MTGTATRSLSRNSSARTRSGGRLVRVPTSPRYVGGVAVGGLQPWNTGRAQEYALLAAAKARWIRSDLAWMYIEATQGVWDWSLYDPVVADATAAGCRYLAVLHTVPDWANSSGGDYALPADLTLIQTYAYRVASHYIPLGVTDYEIGNEINSDHPGWVNPSGTVYATQWLPYAVAGVRQAASELGAAVNILMGSLLPFDWASIDPATFLTDAYAHGAHGLFNATAWHPYSGGDFPSGSAQFGSELDAIRTVMAANGDATMRIWATEYGQASGGDNSFTEAQQAALVPDAYATWHSRPYTGPLLWYSGRDTGTDAHDREQHFGLLRNDFSSKPSYTAIQALLAR